MLLPQLPALAPSLSWTGGRGSRTPSIASSRTGCPTGGTRRSSRAITPFFHPQTDPLKAQYEKRLLLGRISADRARELPPPLISHMIDNRINENHIPGIRRPDGSVSTRQEDIHNGFHSFYSDLYSHKPTSTTHINKNIPRLPPELIASLSNPVTIADVLCVAKGAKKNSAPGPDGIPYSLYERVPILQVLLVKVIQAAIQTGRFPSSWGLSFIRPILKPGKDPLLASSYRPIALLCTDYKIFTSVIAGRFKPYLITISPTIRVASSLGVPHIMGLCVSPI